MILYDELRPAFIPKYFVAAETSIARSAYS